MTIVISTKPPIGLNQEKVFEILIKHGYDDIEFLQKQSGWLSVRRLYWREIGEGVMDEIKEIYPKSYMFWNDDKSFRRHELILDI